ncbi:hypothetical protein B0H13DRAFT_2280737 [Mycena leptocephala]|nr:hypothetical protein B0H13DRAFT_2280737 [Mycena leptocephala]
MTSMRAWCAPYSHTCTPKSAPLSNSTAVHIRTHPRKTSAYEEGARWEGGFARVGTRASPSLRVRGLKAARSVLHSGGEGEGGAGTREQDEGEESKSEGEGKSARPQGKPTSVRRASPASPNLHLHRHTVPAHLRRPTHEMHEVRETDEVHTCGEVAAVAASQACTDLAAPHSHMRRRRATSCRGGGEEVGSEPKSGLHEKAKNAESSKGKRAEDTELSVVRASAWRNQAGIRPSARCESAHGLWTAPTPRWTMRASR